MSVVSGLVTAVEVYGRMSIWGGFMADMYVTGCGTGSVWMERVKGRGLDGSESRWAIRVEAVAVLIVWVMKWGMMALSLAIYLA